MIPSLTSSLNQDCGCYGEMAWISGAKSYGNTLVSRLSVEVFGLTGFRGLHSQIIPRNLLTWN